LHKEQVVFRVVQTVFQMADNAAARTHAGSGDDDGRAFEVQQAAVTQFLAPMWVIFMGVGGGVKPD